MRGHNNRTNLVGLACLCFLGFAQLVCADGGDDFSNNLFSDLAPLLTLFGEQVAKQYLSQSLLWLDAVIFAMAPLGIITAVVSAIRVGGPRWLRAVIGRARESKGEAELELMSSTSADVCELWNGETIVRTLGSPYVTEVLWLEKTDSVRAIGPSMNLDGSDEDTLLDTKNEESRRAFLAPFAGVFSLTDALTAKLVRSSRKTDVVEVNHTPSQLFDNNVFELEAEPVLVSVPAPESRRRRRRQKRTENIVVCPPNLSLNVTGDATSRTELAIVALFASLFQFGVIAFQLVITYLHPFNENFTKNNRRVPPYACPLTVTGTVFVILGMFACSMVVQKRSKEEDWHLERKNIPEGYRLRIAWLQRHQRVTDQNFGGFCLYAPTNRRQIMSSRFNNTKESPNVATVLGSAVSVVGFVVQFTGLRGMHYSATLAQLAATLFASLLRIMVRRQLGNRPILDTVPDGQELDWMARKTTNCSKWTVKPLNTSDPPEEGDLGTFATRSRLREICPWPLEDRSTTSLAESLAKAMEELTNFVYSSDIELKESAKSLSYFEFQVHVAFSRVGSKRDELEKATIKIEIYRDVMVDDRNSNWTGWKVDRNALEAILTLWKYNIDEDEDQPDTGHNERTQSIILLGASSEFNTLDYDIFIGNSDKCLRMEDGLEDLGTSKFPVAEHRVFGYLGSDPDEEHLALVSFANILDLCARHLLTCYFYRVCQLIHNFNGQTTAFRNPDLTVAESILRMNNSNLDKMVDILHASGISGTPEDLLVILVPALQKNGNLLRIFDAFSKIVQEIQEAEASSLKPIISKEMLFHMAEQALKKFRNSNHWLHAGDFVFGLLETCQRLLGPNHPWTLTARALASRACFSIETQIFCKLEFQNIQEKKPLAEICRSLALHSERVLGEDSDECKLLWRLHAKASFTESRYSIAAAEVVELPPTHVFGPAPQSRPTTAPSRRPSNASTRSRASRALSPTSSIYKRSSDPTVRAIQLLRPNLNFGFVKTFPPALWVYMKTQNLVALYDMLMPPDGSPLTPDEIILVSNTFIIAAGCGYPRVVELCLTRFQDICCYSAVGTGASFSKAVKLATMNNDETILDLILSSLDRDQMISLEAVGASDNLNCLQLACRDGATEIAHLLLRAGMNAKGPPDTSDFRQLPIYLAAKGNYTDIISLLLFYGAAANYQELENGNTFLHYAAENQAKETIEFALSSESTMVPVFFIPNYEGNNVLDIAILLGQDSTAIRILNAMIEYSDQPDWELDLRTHINRNGQTALHLACICNRPEIVKILLNNGFTPERKGLEEFSAYETAAMYGSCDVGKVLLGFNPRSTISKLDDDGWWPILLAVHNDRTDYVRFLLDNGADMETTDGNANSTPISVAVCRDNSALVEILMARGANLMVQDHDGQNLFHLAAISDSTGCLDCLFRTSNNQIDQLIGQLNSAHATPLQTALLHGNLAAAGNILKHIRSLDIINQPMANGMNAVHLICSFLIFGVDYLGVVVVRYFLKDYIKDIGPLPKPPPDILKKAEKLWGEHAEPGAIDLLETILSDGTIDVNDTDNLGYTPLFYAAASGSLGICSLLLERMGPHYDRKLLEKPMHVALYTGDMDIIKLFLSAGMNPDEPFQHSNQSPIAHLLRIAASTRGKVNIITTLPPEFEDYDDIGPWESDVQLLDCLQLFLDAGASLDPSEEQLKTKSSLLHLAILSKSPEVFSQLVNSGANPTLDVTLTPPLLHFSLAAGSDNINLIPLFCRLGMDINAVDRDGKSALTIEIGEQKMVTVAALLENGAVLKTDGPIPDMILAARKGAYPVFRTICEHQKRVSPTNSDYISFLNTSTSIANVPSCTAVHVAAGLGYNDILGFLRDEGADMDGKDANGHNALSYALVQQPTMIWLITDCGIDPNERLTTEGYTAAHLAVSSIEEVGRVIEALQCLWRLGADFNIEDNSGRLPYDYIDLGNAAWMKIPEAKEKVRRLFSRCESPGGRYVLFDESYEAIRKAQGVIAIAESLATPIGYQGNRISSSSIDFQV